MQGPRSVALAGEWMQLTVSAICDARADGDIGGAEDAEQLAFELTGYLLLGNTQLVVTQKPAVDSPRPQSPVRYLGCIIRAELPDGSRKPASIP
jgi:hypothetical protein